MTDTETLLHEGLEALSRGPDMIDAVTAGLDDQGWRARPAPEEWSPLEIVCHLRDEEAEDFGARVRVILGGGERFAPIDPPRWAVERGYREAEPERALDAFRSERRASLEFLSGVPSQALARGIDHPGLGRFSGLDLLAAWVAHDRLHLAQLAATTARLWADRWAPLRADYAGPIPYPPGANAS